MVNNSRLGTSNSFNPLETLKMPQVKAFILAHALGFGLYDKLSAQVFEDDKRGANNSVSPSLDYSFIMRDRGSYAPYISPYLSTAPFLQQGGLADRHLEREFNLPNLSFEKMKDFNERLPVVVYFLNRMSLPDRVALIAYTKLSRESRRLLLDSNTGEPVANSSRFQQDERVSQALLIKSLFAKYHEEWVKNGGGRSFGDYLFDRMEQVKDGTRELGPKFFQKPEQLLTNIPEVLGIVDSIISRHQNAMNREYLGNSFGFSELELLGTPAFVDPQHSFSRHVLRELLTNDDYVEGFKILFGTNITSGTTDDLRLQYPEVFTAKAITKIKEDQEKIRENYKALESSLKDIQYSIDQIKELLKGNNYPQSLNQINLLVEKIQSGVNQDIGSGRYSQEELQTLFSPVRELLNLASLTGPQTKEYMTSLSIVSSGIDIFIHSKIVNPDLAVAAITGDIVRLAVGVFSLNQNRESESEQVLKILQEQLGKLSNQIKNSTEQLWAQIDREGRIAERDRQNIKNEILAALELIYRQNEAVYENIFHELDVVDRTTRAIAHDLTRSIKAIGDGFNQMDMQFEHDRLIETNIRVQYLESLAKIPIEQIDSTEYRRCMYAILAPINMGFRSPVYNRATDNSLDASGDVSENVNQSLFLRNSNSFSRGRLSGDLSELFKLSQGNYNTEFDFLANQRSNNAESDFRDFFSAPGNFNVWLRYVNIFCKYAGFAEGQDPNTQAKYRKLYLQMDPELKQLRAICSEGHRIKGLLDSVFPKSSDGAKLLHPIRIPLENYNNELDKTITLLLQAGRINIKSKPYDRNRSIKRLELNPSFRSVLEWKDRIQPSPSYFPSTSLSYNENSPEILHALRALRIWDVERWTKYIPKNFFIARQLCGGNFQIEYTGLETENERPVLLVRCDYVHPAYGPLPVFEKKIPHPDPNVRRGISFADQDFFEAAQNIWNRSDQWEKAIDDPTVKNLLSSEVTEKCANSLNMLIQETLDVSAIYETEGGSITQDQIRRQLENYEGSRIGLGLILGIHYNDTILNTYLITPSQLLTFAELKDSEERLIQCRDLPSKIYEYICLESQGDSFFDQPIVAGSAHFGINQALKVLEGGYVSIANESNQAQERCAELRDLINDYRKIREDLFTDPTLMIKEQLYRDIVSRVGISYGNPIFTAVVSIASSKGTAITLENKEIIRSYAEGLIDMVKMIGPEAKNSKLKFSRSEILEFIDRSQNPDRFIDAQVAKNLRQAYNVLVNEKRGGNPELAKKKLKEIIEQELDAKALIRAVSKESENSIAKYDQYQKSVVKGIKQTIAKVNLVSAENAVLLGKLGQISAAITQSDYVSREEKFNIANKYGTEIDLGNGRRFRNIHSELEDIEARCKKAGRALVEKHYNLSLKALAGLEAKAAVFLEQALKDAERVASLRTKFEEQLCKICEELGVTEKEIPFYVNQHNNQGNVFLMAIDPNAAIHSGKVFQYALERQSYLKSLDRLFEKESYSIGRGRGRRYKYNILMDEKTREAEARKLRLKIAEYDLKIKQIYQRTYDANGLGPVPYKTYLGSAFKLVINKVPFRPGT